MDNDVSKMDWKVENKLDLGMKIKALMQGKHRARTSRSLSAGRRLMTAYNWHDIFFQTYLVLHFVRANLQTAQRQ
jgi:outer membrane protease